MIISAEHIGKRYQLGEFNLRSAVRDMRRWMTGQKNESAQEASWALRDVNFSINAGEVVGVIGKNGAGKSTLLKILSRVTAPTTGRIRIKGRVGSLLEVGTGFHPDLTGRENIFLNGAILGMTKREITSRFDEILDFAGVEKYIDTPVKRYSSGMYVRLAFAVAAHLEPEILIVDEVLAVGDAEFQEKCVGKMKSVSGQGRTVLFVSHNMGTIRALCQRGILLKGGTMALDAGIDEAIDLYLQSGTRLLEDGTVPDTGNRSSTEGRIRSIRLFDSRDNHTRDFLYGSRIGMDIQFESDIQADRCLIGIQVSNSLNEKVLDFVNMYDGRELSLHKGQNLFRVILDNNLHPGRYYLNVTVARLSGVPIDSLESVAEINISNLGETAESGYPFAWTNGYIKGGAEWKKLTT